MVIGPVDWQDYQTRARGAAAGRSGE
jgi:hypothetical protein